MEKDNIPDVVVHIVPSANARDLMEEVDHVYCRFVRRYLDESPCTPAQKEQLLKELSERLRL